MTKSFHYLSGTNILSGLVRTSQGVIARRIAEAGEETICTSIIVTAERRFGAEKSGSAKLADQVNFILSALEILPLEPSADRQYASLSQYLASRGTLIGPNDVLIPAQAFRAGLTVVTAGTGEFTRVPGLSVEIG